MLKKTLKRIVKSMLITKSMKYPIIMTIDTFMNGYYLLILEE